jgi:hypothetical protein
MKINGDLIPGISGQSHLGVDGSLGDAFDITTLAPFGHIHLVSGVFHDPIMGQSGVLRYNRQRASFQVSVDGGLTFNDIATGATVVTSVGVIGGANLTGDVDLSPTTSGFIVIGDTGGASPVTFSIDVWALSGLYRFPTQGFAGMPKTFAQTFGAAVTWTVTHNLNTTDVQVETYDANSPRLCIIPDAISVTNSNTVTITWNVAQAGRVIIVGF